MTMRRDLCLKAIARHVGDTDIVLPVYSTAFDWIDIRPSALNYLAHGAMGLASSHALGLALGIQAFLVKPYRIPSGSMLPTLTKFPDRFARQPVSISQSIACWIATRPRLKFTALHPRIWRRICGRRPRFCKAGRQRGAHQPWTAMQ